VKSPSCASINRPLAHCAAIFSIVVLLTGCGRDDVKVYHVAKDDSTPPDETVALEQSSASQPQLHWTLPGGWQEKAPSQMRVASFNVAGANGETADVGVIPLPVTGREIQLVNMWREQMQLPDATNADAETVAIGPDQGKLFDIASSAAIIDGKFRARILVAELTRDATSWFFKMTGEDSFVASQKQNFLQFLKSVSFVENAPAQISNVPITQNESATSIWSIPSDWQQLPPSEFLVAKFLVQNGDAKAEVNVSSLAGKGGGLAANVNRWRGQLGLPPIIEILTTSISVTVGTAQVVDFTGTDSKTGKPARLVGAIVPQNGQTWFYKLMGDEQIVAQQKDAFIKFIQSANYANAR